MRSVLLLSLLFCVAASLSTKKYIIVFHKNTTDIQQSNHVGRLQENVYANFAIGEDFRAFAAHLTPQQVIDELASGEVNYIEEDGIVHAYQSCKVQDQATWGLNRISEQDIELTGEYRYSLDGAGVTAFVIDTGILITHKEFTGRVEWGTNTVGDGVNNDCNGHGTHVAGTVAGTTYGVAKKATLVAVKVLGCTGSGTNAGVISGIQYVATSKRRPAVANMSLGGGYSKATNDAVAAGVKAGVTFVVAAGNENQDACNVSPASEATAITVGATDVDDQNLNDQFDTRSSFSNYGSCVKIFAPGTLITSAWYKSDTSINTISGTSMASPHVAGVAAQYLGQNPSATPAAVRSALVSKATSGAIQLLCSTTSCKASPNLLLYSSC